jgi:predicted regulator of Ras-like GTPase activity (Roadblock/LC7/MglB family)
MSFETILRSILDDCGGAIGIALMGSDGVPVEQVQARAGDSALLSEDIGTAGAEFGRILDEIRKASDALGGGAMNETMVSLSRFTLIFRAVDDDLFVVLAITPDGNLGKARYLIRRHLLAIRQEL